MDDLAQPATRGRMRDDLTMHLRDLDSHAKLTGQRQKALLPPMEESIFEESIASLNSPIGSAALPLRIQMGMLLSLTALEIA